MRINTCVTTLTPLFSCIKKSLLFLFIFFACVHFFFCSRKKKKEKRSATAAKTHPHFTWNYYSSFGIAFIIINTYVSVKEKEESSATISETVLLA